MAVNSFGAPIPLSEIESVLAWVDTFKLSRATKKINRDFSDAVLLAEILSVHYPKLVEMHNYPPRNSHALKLNNWMTLNRKVLKKLKLNLCCNTMEQLANCAPGIIERVLVMVRDKIRRDEELNKSMREAEQNVSSGGSYYEACGDDGNGNSSEYMLHISVIVEGDKEKRASAVARLRREHVLVVPVKMRVNGVLETIQQKVIRHDSYLTVKEELKDAKDIAELLKQRVEHLDSLIKLKDERIEELQKQLERKQSRRREVEPTQSNNCFPPIPPDPEPLTPVIDNAIIENPLLKMASSKSIPLETKPTKPEESKIPIPLTDFVCNRVTSKPSLTRVALPVCEDIDVDRIKSDVFEETVVLEERVIEVDEFKDSEQGCAVVTIEETIQKEVKDLSKPIEVLHNNFI